MLVGRPENVIWPRKRVVARRTISSGRWPSSSGDPLQTLIASTTGTVRPMVDRAELRLRLTALQLVAGGALKRRDALRSQDQSGETEPKAQPENLYNG